MPAEEPNKGQRKEQRKNLFIYLRVVEGNTMEMIGRLADASESGLLLLTEKEMSVNEIYDMEIEYHLSETSTARIPIEGQVRWCKPDVNPSHFAVGFKITKIEPNMKIRLKQIISYLKFRN